MFGELSPHLFIIIKSMSITYILWLAWKKSFVRFSFDKELNYAPSFLSGLIVHVLNPKTWLMVTASFSSFGNDQMRLLYQKLLIAVLVLLLFNVFLFNLVYCWK